MYDDEPKKVDDTPREISDTPKEISEEVYQGIMECNQFFQSLSSREGYEYLTEELKSYFQKYAEKLQELVDLLNDYEDE
ncbi:MAG: hypothetical protein LBF22_06305 [Deltaproteobacteria bacterium]|jgi:hypothetical protein|nr:hypothetical protein [Deltaproteobacteria bacterium]